MKTKIKITILFLFFIAFSVNAQTAFNTENVGESLDENIKTIYNVSLPIKSANEDIVVLDSSIHMKFRSTYNDTTKYYYKYDRNGNTIEEIIFTTVEGAASGLDNSKIQYFYDENDSVKGIIQYDLDCESNRWIPGTKSDITYLPEDNRMNGIHFEYDTILEEWISDMKYEVILDEHGNTISDTRYKLNESNQWYPYQKTESSFDEQGRFLGTVNYRWNDSENQLEYSRKSIREYSEDGSQVLITGYYFDKNSEQWIGDEQTKIVWENGKYIEYVVSDWDNDIAQWIYNYKYERTYDSYGNETSSSKYKWDLAENNWKGDISRKSTFSYTATGLIESVSRYTLDTTGQWIGIDKKEYAYNEVGKEILYIEFDWDAENSDWIYSAKIETGYNSSNKEITSTGYGWDATISDWGYSYKRAKEYNSNDQITLSETYLWDALEQVWKIKDKRVLEYDSYGNNSKVSEYKVYKDDVLELIEIKEYFYSELTTNTEIISQSQTIKLYPNPANDVLTIETQNPEITYGKLYDLNGKLMKYLTIHRGINSFDISDLKSGVYIIQIQQNEGMLVEKLVKN